MQKKQLLIILIILIPLISFGQIPDGFFIDMDKNAPKGIELKPFIQKKKKIYHFAVLDTIPFKTDCDLKSERKKKIRCIEDNLADIIMGSIENKSSFKGYVLVYFTVNQNAEIIDIGTKSYPDSHEINEIIKSGVEKIPVTKAFYKRKNVNARLFTRLDFE